MHILTFFTGLGFILGTVLGSFSKALADRSLTNKSFSGRSKCPHCKHQLSWIDLFPVFSFLILRGKCRYCKKPFGLEYLIVELLMGLLVGFLFWQAGGSFQFSVFSFQFSIFLIDLLLKAFFITVLMVVFLTDLKEMFIPDRIIIPAILISLVTLILGTLYKVTYLYYYLNQTTLGKMLLPPNDYFGRHVILIVEPLLNSIFAGLLVAVLFGFLILITRGRGMGGGDVKLGAFLGIMLGLPNSLVALLLSFTLGAVVAIVLIFFKKKSFGQVIPFGPFLVSGSLMALYFGPQIVHLYLNWGIDKIF